MTVFLGRHHRTMKVSRTPGIRHIALTAVVQRRGQSARAENATEPKRSKVRQRQRTAVLVPPQPPPDRPNDLDLQAPARSSGRKAAVAIAPIYHGSDSGT
jgi:hypothetical protein